MESFHFKIPFFFYSISPHKFFGIIDAVGMNSRTISNSNSDSKSLSLAVLGQQEALSLQVCSERKIVRRSPRFTYTPSSDYCVRRSPRFARAGVVLNGKNKQCGLDFKNFNDKSPKRLLRSAANGQSNKATVKVSHCFCFFSFL